MGNIEVLAGGDLYVIELDEGGWVGVEAYPPGGDSVVDDMKLELVIHVYLELVVLGCDPYGVPRTGVEV